MQIFFLQFHFCIPLVKPERHQSLLQILYDQFFSKTLNIFKALYFLYTKHTSVAKITGEIYYANFSKKQPA